MDGRKQLVSLGDHFDIFLLLLPDIDFWLLRFFRCCSWWIRVFGWFSVTSTPSQLSTIQPCYTIPYHVHTMSYHTRPPSHHPTMLCSDHWPDHHEASWLPGLCVDDVHWCCSCTCTVYIARMPGSVHWRPIINHPCICIYITVQCNDDPPGGKLW